MQKPKRPWLLIFLPILLIAAHSLGALAPLERATSRLLSPTQGAFFRLGSALRSVFSGFYGSAGEVQALKEERAKLYSEIVKLNELEAEVRELRGLLNFKKRTEVKTAVANVIGERTITSARTLLIDKGAEDGIARDYPVVNQDGILVGKVFEVKERSSLVLMLLDRRSRVAATIQNKDGTIGVVEGGYGLSSSMKFIPQNEIVEVGNMVITSGLEETVPRGLLIGTVESVVKEVREPFQEATIKPMVEFEKLITVAVILP